MELRAGATKSQAERALDQLIRAYTKASRLIAPAPALYDKAGEVLRRLRGEGRDVRRAALVNDVLIALTTRALGATLLTKDVKDFRVIKDVTGAKVEFVISL
jgi:predicted nucleic acid-binding protein